MAKANHAHTTVTMLDAIAPNRVRFNVNHNPNPRNATMALIDRLAAKRKGRGQ